MVKIFDVYDSILICGLLDKKVVKPRSLCGISYNSYAEYCKNWYKVEYRAKSAIYTLDYRAPIYLIKEATADEGMDDIVKHNNELLEKAKKHKKFKSKFYLWMNYV